MTDPREHYKNELRIAELMRDGERYREIRALFAAFQGISEADFDRMVNERIDRARKISKAVECAGQP